MIDDEIDLTSRVDLFRISSQTLDGISHGGEVDNERDTGEILKDNTCRFEGNFNILGGVNFPIENLFDIRR